MRVVRLQKQLKIAGDSFMDKITRKFAILNLTLALIVLALFGFAPSTIDSHHTDPDVFPEGSGLALEGGVGMPAIQ